MGAIDIKRMIGVLVRILLMGFLFFGIQVFASFAAGVSQIQSDIDAAQAAQYLLAMSLLTSAVWSLPLLRSRLFGLQLTLAVFVIFFGISTLLTQVETAVFLQFLVNSVPREMLPKLIVQGTITAAIFAPAAVLVFGRVRPKGGFYKNEVQMPTLASPVSKLLFRIVIVAIIYVFVYIGFGMFVMLPLAGSAFNEFYGNLQMPWWILFLQLGRGIIWAVLAVVIIRTTRGSRLYAALTTALLFSVLMGGELLVPNPFMPDAIRLAHLVEISSSNFVFGLIAALLLTQKRPRGWWN